MSIFNLYDQDNKKSKRRLIDIVTKELSIVRRGANNKVFIFVKSADGSIIGTGRQGVTDEPWNGYKSRFTIEQLVKAVPVAILKWAKKRAEKLNRDITKRDLQLPFKEPDGTININGVKKVLRKIDSVRTPISLPASIKTSVKKELKDLLDRISKEDSMKKKKVKKKDLGFGNDPGFEDPTNELLEKASDLIEEVDEQFDLDDIDAENSGDDQEIEKFEISENLQKEIVKSSTGILERLVNFIDVVKGAPVSDDDDADMPTTLGRSINRISRDLEAIVAKYPAPLGKEKLTEENRPRIAKKITESIERLMKALESVRDAEVADGETEFPISAEFGQMIFDTTKSLDRLAKRYPSLVGRYESPSEVNEDEDDVQDGIKKSKKKKKVKKSGRKFSAKNLDAIKDIQDKLAKLLGDDPDEEGDADPVEPTSEEASAQKALAATVADGFEKAIAPLKEALEKLVDVQKANSEDISKLKGEHPAPKSRKVEKTDGGEDNDDHWPSDMNRPLDKESVPDSRYMG